MMLSCGIKNLGPNPPILLYWADRPTLPTATTKG